MILLDISLINRSLLGIDFHQIIDPHSVANVRDPLLRSFFLLPHQSTIMTNKFLECPPISYKSVIENATKNNETRNHEQSYKFSNILLFVL